MKSKKKLSFLEKKDTQTHNHTSHSTFKLEHTNHSLKHNAPTVEPQAKAQALGRLLMELAGPHDRKCGHWASSLLLMRGVGKQLEDASSRFFDEFEAWHWDESIAYVHSHPLQ